jgi:tetrahedral aminopeptidase
MQPAVHEFPKRSLEFLFELLATPSVSGHEEPAQRVFVRYARELGLTVGAGAQGNAWAVLGSEANGLIGFEAHVDQIGLMVRHIADEGYLHCAFLGGSWEISSRRVTVHTANGPIPGVIGKQPVSYADSAEGTVKVHQYWVDIGARDGDDARSKVAIGDSITYDGPPVFLGEDLLMSCGLDDRIGVFCAIEALRLLQDEGWSGDCGVAAVSCVQEEVSMVGASTAAYELPLKALIALDVWPFVTDVPETDARRYGALKSGEGPCVVRGPNVAPRVFDELLAAAKGAELPHQVQAWPGTTPTDAREFFRAKSGIATGLVGIPERYLHSPSEVVHLGDVWNCVRLLAEFAKRAHGTSDLSRRAAVLDESS